MSVLALLRRSALASLVVFTLAACQGGEVEIDDDPDQDGLENAQEEEVGTDLNNPDTDGDGIEDGEEVLRGLDPLDPDMDDDLLNDGDELANGTDPTNPDTDGGGTPDGNEVSQGRNPLDPTDDDDRDNDLLSDQDEVERYGTDPDNPDTDGDGLSDHDEVRIYRTDPNEADTDEDGLTDDREVDAGTNPRLADTDEDGLTDLQEIEETNTDPTSADGDEDGLTDRDELETYFTDPNDDDTDGDSLADGREVLAAGSDPLSVDGDGDGLLDPDEFTAGTNPRRADTDGDGLLDLTEVQETRTNPLLYDSDNDGLPDGLEVNGVGALEPYGPTDPLNADSDGDELPDGLELTWAVHPLVRDSDLDGVDDGIEVYDLNTDPNDDDSDDDSLPDGEELDMGTDPLLRDTDADGLDDGDEVFGFEFTPPGATEPVTFYSNPLLRDTDDDGIADLQEGFRFGTDPRRADTDGDLLTDQEEVFYRFDPLEAGDGTSDIDGDGLTAREELDLGTDPRVPDSDFDRLPDGEEALLGTDPLYPDTDGDTLSDGEEWLVGADPTLVDSDFDGINDGDERTALVDVDNDGLVGAVDADSDNDGLLDSDELELHGTDERNADTDGDGIPDGPEIERGLDPLNAADALRDPDNDGLSNVEEYRFGSDHLSADSDGDGVPDGVEIASGLNPNSDADGFEDFDLDGISNRDELCPEGASGAECFGDSTDIRDSDSDGDGLADSLDTVPNNPDRDGDGLSDGDEVYVYDSDPEEGDSDGDGLSDAEELATGGSTRRADADGDGLSDGDEIANGSDPASSDTDGDGLTDFEEVTRGFFVVEYDRAIAATDERLFRRVQVFTNPSLEDSDGDGFGDAIEVATGTNPNLADTDGDGLSDGEERDFQTDALNHDTDGDGIEDGIDPNPLDLDADFDGIPDTAELVDGYNARILTINAEPSIDETIDISAIPNGWYRVSALAGPSGPVAGRSGGEPTVTLTVSADGTTDLVSSHALRWDGARRVISAPFRTTGEEVRVQITAGAGPAVTVDDIVFELVDADALGTPIRTLSTFADRADSDGDGLDDALEAGRGVWIDTSADGRPDVFEPGRWIDFDDDGIRELGESSEGFWAEAEHYAVNLVARGTDANASNGALVTASVGDLVFGSGGGQWGYTPATAYSVFLRGRVPTNDPDVVDIDGCTNEGCPNYIWVTIDRGDSTVDDCGPGVAVCASRVTFSNQLEWRYAGTYTPGNTFEITVQELLNAGVNWELDRIAILPIEFEPSLDIRVDAATIAAPQRVEGIDSGFIEFDIALPWGVSDPMEVDTDGDGYRSTPVLCQQTVGASSACPSGEIEGSIGWLTDGHELVITATNPFDIDSDHDADLYPQLGGIFGGDGVFDLLGETAPQYTDNIDPYPASTDRDFDGISNELEIALWDEACNNPAYTGNLECPDDDATGQSCVQLATGPTDIPCWFTDDDRDNDGIPDGVEDANQNGRLDVDELDPNNRDTDGDGIEDGVELGLTAPRSRDFAADGLIPTSFFPDTQPDTTTNPLSADTDGDGLLDGDEDLDGDGRFLFDVCLTGADDIYASCGDRTITNPRTAELRVYTTPERSICETNPISQDTDSDGVSDEDEIVRFCTSPISADTDRDGLTDLVEIRQTLTDPNVADTDGDGLEDGEEVDILTGLVLADPLSFDTDEDGLNDFDEVNGALPSNPNLVDTDGDGLSDFDEVNGSPQTDPSRFDTDGDTLSDFFELYGEDTNRNGELDPGEDVDGDGVLDLPGTDPNNPDSDGDLFRDGEELRGDADPLDPESKPERIDDAGGLSIDTDEDVVVETDDDGVPTGILTVTDSQIDLNCPGRAITAYVDGTMTIDRTDPSRQEVYADGTFYVLAPGGLGIPVWSGRTDFIGYDPDTGMPTNSSLARSPAEFRPDALSFGDGGSTIDLAFDTGVFFDVCTGDLGGEAEWYLGDDSWRLGARSEVAFRPRTLGFTTNGVIRFDTPIGPVYLSRAELEVSLLEFYASGSGGLQIPGLQDLVKLFPEENEVDAESSDCPVCVDFLIDPANGRFRFMPSLGYEMSIGPMTASVEGPSLPEFEIDIPRGYIYVAGGFEYGEIGISGSFAFDLAGQLEFEPAADLPNARTCSTDDDCRYGETCDDGECAGCAARFEADLLPRYDVEFGDDGSVEDLYQLDISGTLYRCPAGGVGCDEDERIEVREYERTYRTIQNGRLDTGDLAELMAETINADTIEGCDDACEDQYQDCAISQCPGICLFDTSNDLCQDCADATCQPLEDACLGGCGDGLPVEAYANDGVVTIESDTFLFEFEVTPTYNGSEDEETLGVEEAEAVNGHLDIQAEVGIPLAQPVFSLNLGGALFTDLFPTSYDGDPNFFAGNVTVGFGASFGPVGLGLEMGGATVQLALDRNDDLDYMLISTSEGIKLDNIVSGLPGGLGNLGNGQDLLLGYDNSTMTLCGEGEYRQFGFTIPWAFNVTPPYNPETDGFDTGYGGMYGTFGVILPLWFGEAFGYGAVEWDGDFEFGAGLDLEILPGMQLARGEFVLNNSGTYISGRLDLPAGLGGLSATGELEWTGEFELTLDGNLTIAGFELAGVEGFADNDGVELSARLALPANLAEVEIEGWVRGDGQFYFSGTVDIGLPGGTTLAGARVELSNDGLSIRAGLDVPGITSIQVRGEVRSDGYILLSGSGSIGIGDAVRVGPITLTFERQTNGVISISGSGSITIAGKQIISMAFEIGTDGTFYATGQIDMWIAMAEVTIEKRPGGRVSFSAEVRIEICAFEHCVGGRVTLSYNSGVLEFYIGAYIEGPVLNASIGLGVDTNGCFTVDPLGRFCL